VAFVCRFDTVRGREEPVTRYIINRCRRVTRLHGSTGAPRRPLHTRVATATTTCLGQTAIAACSSQQDVEMSILSTSPRLVRAFARSSARAPAKARRFRNVAFNADLDIAPLGLTRVTAQPAVQSLNVSFHNFGQR